MLCPYCFSDIHDAALVCATCKRDLYIIKPLLERIAVLEAQIAGQLTPEEKQGEGELADINQRPSIVSSQSFSKALACWLLPILLLVLGHWLIVFVYDANALYLRILALLIPVPFGFFFARYVNWFFLPKLLSTVLLAGLSVFSMSAVTGLIDQIPILPQNMLELREFIEFSASIGFSFTTGLWLEFSLRRRAEQQRQFAEQQRKLSGRAVPINKKIIESLTNLNDLGRSLVALATTAVSIYTGLKGFLIN